MLKRDLVSLEDCWNFPLRLVVNQANAEGLEEGWTELGIVFFPFLLSECLMEVKLLFSCNVHDL
jgi:hypothetical protein